MDGAFASPADQAFGTLSRLAAALADPFTTFDREQWSLGDLSASEIEIMAADAAFRQPLRRAASQQVTASLAALPRETFVEIAGTREGRLAIALLSQPVTEIVDLALLCAAAAFHRDIIAVAGKAERETLRQSLGAAAYQLATQEARGLYPALGLLGDPQAFRAILGAGDAAAIRSHFAGYGVGLLVALCRPAAAALSDLVGRRLPAGWPMGKPPAVPAEDLSRLFRLIDRRRPAWLATIG